MRLSELVDDDSDIVSFVLRLEVDAEGERLTIETRVVRNKMIRSIIMVTERSKKMMMMRRLMMV